VVVLSCTVVGLTCFVMCGRFDSCVGVWLICVFVQVFLLLLLFFGLAVANAPDVSQPCGLLYYP
jgi:hypothetical protein